MSYMKQKDIELRNALKDIGRGMNPDNQGFDVFKHAYDFHVTCEGDMSVIWADTDVALKWCYENLPEGIDRRTRGFVVESTYVGIITQGMRRADLVDESDAEEELSREHWAHQQDQDEEWMASQE